MYSSARTQEIKDGFAAVLQGVAETGDTVQQLRPDIGLVLNRSKIEECLKRLDQYAEELQRLDQDLSEITRVTNNIEEHFSNMREYTALFSLGASVHEALYNDYQLLRALRDKMNMILITLLTCTGALIGVFALFL